MELIVKITNKELYNDKVIDVDLTGLYSGMTGTIEIETEEQGRIVFTGEHGETDYEEDFGFIITEQNWEEIEHTTEAIEDAKNEGYTLLLEVKSEYLYAIMETKELDWDYAANEIAKSHGIKRHDHDSDEFFGCSIDEGIRFFVETQFVIIDVSANDDSIHYVCEDGTTSTVIENAIRFDSEDEAEEKIFENNWAEWASTIELED